MKKTLCALKPPLTKALRIFLDFDRNADQERTAAVELTRRDSSSS